MDKTSKIIIKICIFSIILSITALLLCMMFNYTDKNKEKNTISSTSEKPVVIIDAGHGGEDGGASSADGVKEKDLNLDVALTLGKMLEANGISVIQTRTEDIMLYSEYKKGSLKMQDLKNRLEISKENDNSIFVSIHMNKFSEEKYSGLQVFYSKNSEQSTALANTIQKNVKEYLQPENDRETKPAGSNIYLLDRIDTPAVLIECGFLSNPVECPNLSDQGYRKELAAVIYSSIIEFLG